MRLLSRFVWRAFAEILILIRLESYLEAGYEYVNIDDCWSELERDENGKIVANKERFPRGKKFLSDYVSCF